MNKKKLFKYTILGYYCILKNKAIIYNWQNTDTVLNYGISLIEQVVEGEIVKI